MALLKHKTTTPDLDLTASTRTATAAAGCDKAMEAQKRVLDAPDATTANREVGRLQQARDDAADQDRRFGTPVTRSALARADGALADAKARYAPMAEKVSRAAAEADRIGAEAADLADKASAALAADLAPTIKALEDQLDGLAAVYASTLRLHALLTSGHVEARTAVPRHDGYGLFVSDAELAPEHRSILDKVEDVRSLIHRGEMAAREHRQALAKAGMSQPIRAA